MEKSDTCPRVSAEAFLAYLERSDITNADAARMIGTTSKTVQIWLREGVTGSADNLIAFLIEASIPLHIVGQRIGIHMSTHRRSAFAGNRKAKVDEASNSV